MTVTTKQLLFILENTPASQNIMLVGKHGIGKSRILEDFYTKRGMKVVTLFLGQMSDPGDLIGLPEKNSQTGKTDFLLPYWFPVDQQPIVLFLDELNRARPEVLQTVMDLTLNRKLAGKSLPEGSRIISAVNGGNEYQLTDLDPALVSRFNIYEFSPSVEEWLEWGKESGIDPRIISFIENHSEFLDGEEASDFSENLERTADRRSWERLSQIIKGQEELKDEHKVLASGIVGDKAASLFFHFIQESNLLTAGKILLSGLTDEVKERLKTAPLSDITFLNTSIFSSLREDRQEPSKNQLVAKNLEDYFDFMKEEKGMETISHFCSLMSSSSYPKALIFISKNSPSLYQKVMDTISEM